MKILLLSDINSSHTIRWVKSLTEKNFKVFIFGLSDYEFSNYRNLKNIDIFTMGFIPSNTEDFSKLKYLKALPKLKKIIKSFKPDILHAHYATSYGLLGSLSGFHPFILSVWGTDIFDFPNRSFLHKILIKYNLYKADKILSTSHIMAREIQKYTQKNIEIIPFGIDLEVFKPQKVKSLFNDKDIVIGTIKTLEKIYGIEYLIKAFKLLKEKYKNLPLKLLIVGGGSEENYLKKLVKELEISDITIFTGKVPYEDVPKYMNMLSIYVAPSIWESFGVSVLEASACEKPVIVSNIGGLTEVVEDGVTGFLVHPQKPEEIALKIEKLIFDEKLSIKMGTLGRKRIHDFFNLENNIKQLIEIYKTIDYYFSFFKLSSSGKT